MRILSFRGQRSEVAGNRPQGGYFECRSFQHPTTSHALWNRRFNRAHEIGYPHSCQPSFSRQEYDRSRIAHESVASSWRRNLRNLPRSRRPPAEDSRMESDSPGTTLVGRTKPHGLDAASTKRRDHPSPWRSFCWPNFGPLSVYLGRWVDGLWSPQTRRELDDVLYQSHFPNLPYVSHSVRLV